MNYKLKTFFNKKVTLNLLHVFGLIKPCFKEVYGITKYTTEIVTKKEEDIPPIGDDSD